MVSQRYRNESTHLTLLVRSDLAGEPRPGSSPHQSTSSARVVLVLSAVNNITPCVGER